MALVGFLGFAFLVNWNPALAILGKSPFRTAANPSMSAIPLYHGRRGAGHFDFRFSGYRTLVAVYHEIKNLGLEDPVFQ